MPAPLLLAALFACTDAAVPFSATFAAEDVTTVQVVSEKGDVRWVTSDTLDVHVSGALTGGGDDLGEWSANLSDGVLRIEIAPKTFASSSLVLEGPASMDVEIEATTSQVWLDGLSASAVVSAGVLEGRDLAVYGSLSAVGALDVEVDPGTDGLTIQVGADSRLAMPYGRDYDLNI